ncbi:hypothetical protein CsSME_00043883 [Camellia sinensis var. sinensis]
MTSFHAAYTPIVRFAQFKTHTSPCFLVKEEDHAIIGQCRLRFNVLKVVPAGSSGGGKKAFTKMGVYHITQVCNVVKSSLFAS